MENKWNRHWFSEDYKIYIHAGFHPVIYSFKNYFSLMKIKSVTGVRSIKWTNVNIIKAILFLRI